MNGGGAPGAHVVEWRARKSSFPVPVSPEISTVAFDSATQGIFSMTRPENTELSPMSDSRWGGGLVPRRLRLLGFERQALESRRPASPTPLSDSLMKRPPDARITRRKTASGGCWSGARSREMYPRTECDLSRRSGMIRRHLECQLAGATSRTMTSLTSLTQGPFVIFNGPNSRRSELSFRASAARAGSKSRDDGSLPGGIAFGRTSAQESA